MKKLHIGTGKCYLPGYVNVDIFSTVHADVYADMTALPFDRESFSEIYCSHTLEHAHRLMVIATLTHWRDLLAPGGTLMLAVPDFAACCEWYAKTKDIKAILGLMFGGQNHPKNNHFIAFDYAYLTECLVKAGFSPPKIHRWDWRTTDHAQFDDYSQAYLPHLDKQGLLMSLNVQATK